MRARTVFAGAALLGCLATANGCALLPVGAAPSGSRGGGVAGMGDGLRAYRVAFHCHSFLSHDSEVPFERIARAAREEGINAVVLTDHYEPGNRGRAPPPVVDGVLFLPGVELRASGGSLLAFGFRSDFDKDAPRDALARRFQSEGGLVVAGHCERIRDWDDFPMDGFEVYNLHAEFAQKNALSIAWRFLALCPEGFFESSITVPRDNLATWDRLLVEGRRLFPMLGCDAHENVRVFGPLGGVLGTYPELLRLFSNHVLATELSAESILEALRRGRVYGVFDHLGDATGFRVSYGSPASAAPEGARAILGEQVRFEPRSTLEVRVPAESTIRLVRNGETRLEVAGTRLDETLPGPGVYRVEVYRGDALWILSGPLYVEP